MFLLLVLLVRLGELHAGPNPHKTFLQTTVPEKISSFDAKRNPENNSCLCSCSILSYILSKRSFIAYVDKQNAMIAYVITIKGKPYFVHLKKQSFLSSVSVVYFYDKDDIKHSKSLLAQMDCSYHGYVAGFPNSLVSLNTCSGLRGTLQLKNISYGIEPMEAISGFVHMIYEEKLGNTNIPLLGENRSYSYDSAYYYNKERSQRTEFFKLYPQNLEMYIIVDKNLFDYMGSDIKAVTQKVIQIIGFVNTMFSQLKLTVVISSIEIWSNKNKISTIGDPNNILSRFLEWKHKHIFRPHQVTYLFAFQKYPSFIGATFPGKICNKNFAVGVALYPEGLSLESYTVSIVQLLGFNLGLSYDDPDICYCSGDVCTMSRKAVQSGGVKEFSTCNLDDFKYLASHSGFECLRNILPEIPVYKQRQRRVCGNGKLEEGEQCDCGTIETCTHKACCDPRSCVIKTGKQCGSGECCTPDCKLRPGGIPCRKSLDECDFTEYCNGVSSHCVPDTYARNGQSCESGDAFCYEGQCRTASKQCKQLIGGASRGGSFACYDEINSRADRYGNCGRDFCSFSNLLCGKLVCAWPHKALVSRANLSVIYSHVREEMCVSTYRSKEKAIKNTWTTYETPEDRDDTFVQDGTVCGPAMYCINFSCVEIQYQINTQQCNSSYCNSHGVCNNLHHCHCEQGFAPPTCLEKKGEFGSIDDGHKAPSGKSNLREGNTTLSKHQFQLIFYISLPVLIITAVVLIKHKKIRELCYRGETESERSVSEESSSNSKLSPSVSNSL
ncbi:disintegrin and metalloproteinase domain-containing protein 5-like [Canis lupus familiaris]|nr:disintegrin and metalloproteinase domain-containing protein 5-like [Canis lupus familiaris]XP_025291565.1 disintegrin and metalloproteinase domain-containing protein 5-like isoform X1 [Canis lupus dingo]XP_038415943.1 disintegrin and metalloproteinase domain-containing protein 5-like [Canis lupus familiaris]XP_038545738.1 disintegrin and metalloproteinase domain-containing protein 5-like [Canis lupus familiaris]|eukprot:XP_022259732.1 disintegrin and metalloproteinase domain-containing protein 5-like [Canis lupus familiaris]